MLSAFLTSAWLALCLASLHVLGALSAARHRARPPAALSLADLARADLRAFLRAAGTGVIAGFAPALALGARLPAAAALALMASLRFCVFCSALYLALVPCVEYALVRLRATSLVEGVPDEAVRARLLAAVVAAGAVLTAAVLPHLPGSVPYRYLVGGTADGGAGGVDPGTGLTTVVLVAAASSHLALKLLVWRGRRREGFGSLPAVSFTFGSFLFLIAASMSFMVAVAAWLSPAIAAGVHHGHFLAVCGLLGVVLPACYVADDPGAVDFVRRRLAARLVGLRRRRRRRRVGPQPHA